MVVNKETLNFSKRSDYLRTDRVCKNWNGLANLYLIMATKNTVYSKPFFLSSIDDGTIIKKLTIFCSIDDGTIIRISFFQTKSFHQGTICGNKEKYSCHGNL